MSPANHVAIVAERLGTSENFVRHLFARGYLTDVESRLKSRIPVAEAEILLSRKELQELKWLAVVAAESWAQLVSHGLTATAFPKSRIGQAREMRAGNQVVFYLTGVGRLVGVAQVSGPPSTKQLGWLATPYPLSVPLMPWVKLDASRGADIRPLLSELDFVKNAANWANYIRGSLHLLSRHDFNVLRHALEAESAAPPTAATLG